MTIQIVLPTTEVSAMTTFARWPAVLVTGLLMLMTTSTSYAIQADDEYALAVGLFKQQRFELAEEAFGKFITSFPEDSKVGTARLYRSQALINLNKYEPARVVLREYVNASDLKANPPDKNLLQALYRVGECSYLLEDYKAAETEFETWMAKAGDDPLLEWGLPYYGDTLLRNNKAQQAVPIFEKSLAKYPQGKLIEDSRFGLAKALEATRQYEKARKIYSEIAGADNQPRSAQALIKLALISYDQKDYAASVASFDQFLKRFPNDSLVSYVWLNRGQASYAQGSYGEAIRSYTQARKNPDYAVTAIFWQGMSEQMQGDHEAALKSFAAVPLPEDQKTGSLGGELIYQTGMSLAYVGKTKEALETWENLLATIPDHARAPDAIIRSLDLEVTAENWTKAEELLKQFHAKYDSSSWKQTADILNAKMLIGKGTQIEANQPVEARQEFLKAADYLEKIDFSKAEESTRLLARYQTARAYHKAGEYQKALNLLEPMMDVKTNQQNFPEAYAVLSISYLALNKNKDAIKAAEGYLGSSNKARKDSATEAQVLTTMAIAMGRLGNADGASGVLGKLLTLNVNDDVKSRLALQVAEDAYKQRQFAVADEFYDEVVSKGAKSPQYVPALWGQAWSAYEQEKYDVASQRFLKLAKLTNQKPASAIEAHHMAGVALQKAGQLPLAAKTFTDGYAPYVDKNVKELSPDVVLQMYRCSKEAARAFRLQKQNDASDKAYQTAVASLKGLSIEEQVNLDKLYDEWALLHYESGEYAKADVIYEKLLSDCPTSSRADDALLVLAESDFINGDVDRSRTRFELLMAREDADPIVRKRSAYQLVMLSAGKKAWQDVVTRADAFLTMVSPTGTPATNAELLLNDLETLNVLYQKAKALVETDQLDAAKTLLGELRTTLEPVSSSLTSEPMAESVASIWLLSAETARRSKQYPEAMTLVSEIDQKFPKSPLRADAQVIAGRCSIAQAKFQNAHDSFTKALQILDTVKNEAAVQSHFYQAETYLMQKRYSDALTSYMRVYLLFPGFDLWRSAALFQTAQCDEMLGHQNNALDSYRKLLQEFPNSLEAPKAQDRLAELTSGK